MSHNHQRHAGIQPSKHLAAALVVGERVRIVNAPASYGYNGRVGVIEAIDGSQISVRVDEPPADFRCSIFYIEELEREGMA